MKLFINPPRNQWPELLSRPVLEADRLAEQVGSLLKKVKEEGDQALLELTERFDKARLSELRVSEAEYQSANEQISPRLQAAIAQAQANITAFHKAQQLPVDRIQTMPGVQCWRKSLPIQKVGLYIPGGTAPLFSSILMLGIPARLAGCERIVLCTPPGPDGSVNPAILHTAQQVGVTEVYKVGGAQAIAAMAYGTESIPQVYKIFGPGNQYVTQAKQMVALQGTAIDMPAGPSEVAVVADESARPDFVAADLLSQAEHGVDSQVLLFTTRQEIAQAIQEEVARQLESLPRKEIASQALANSRAIVMADQELLMEMVNAYAPEHLILSVEEDETWAEQVHTAGSVFLGHFSPESVGDYASGTNHTLPTNGAARAYSGVSLDSFVKKITFQKLSANGLQLLGPHVEVMAEAEQLEAHRRAVSLRLETAQSWNGH